MSQIIIDPDAASADIKKITDAINKLNKSQNSIKMLSTSASDMTGQTGPAIVEKCTQLSSQIDALKTNLNTTIGLINSAIREYQEKDLEAAKAIQNGTEGYKWHTLKLIMTDLHSSHRRLRITSQLMKISVQE